MESIKKLQRLQKILEEFNLGFKVKDIETWNTPVNGSVFDKFHLVADIEEIKKPIFKLNNKFMYEGDEYWTIQPYNNWRLESCNAYVYNAENTELKRFLTKQEALNCVLEEAKERFKYAVGIRHDGFSSKTHDKKFYNELTVSGEVIKDKIYTIWKPEKGWIAEPIKEPSLMLGNEIVEIGNI